MRLGTCTPPRPLAGGKATPYPADRFGVGGGNSSSDMTTSVCQPKHLLSGGGVIQYPADNLASRRPPPCKHRGSLIVASWPQNSQLPPPQPNPEASCTGGCWLIRAGRGAAESQSQPIHQPAKRFPEATPETTWQRANPGTQEPPTNSLHSRRTPRPARRQPAPPGARCPLLRRAPGRQSTAICHQKSPPDGGL